MSLTRLLLRRNRLAIAGWVLLLAGLCAGTFRSYRGSTAGAADQAPAFTLIYGRLGHPGGPEQMFAWEAGAIVTILAAVMAVLLAVALTRAAEDDGTLELLRGQGLPPARPLRSAHRVLAGLAVALAAGCGAAVGSALFGAVVAATFLVVAAGSTLLAQLAANAGQARVLGFAAVGGAFAVRAVADLRDVPALNWLTPLGLRATAGPFTDDRWWALAPPLAVALVLAGAAAALSRRREFGRGLLPRRDTRSGRLRLRTPVGLAARLGRSGLLIWTVGVAAIGGLFATTGADAVQRQRAGDLHGFLGDQLGAGDPVAGYLAYSGTLIGILVSVHAVRSVTRVEHDERTGLTDQVLATGRRRWEPVAAQAVVTAATTAVILAVTAVACAALTPLALDGDDVALRSLGYVLGQWPTALAVIGCAALPVGLHPRLAALAWLPPGVSAVLALLGGLLGIPEQVRDLGLLQHAPHLPALLALVALGAGLAVLGVAASARREVVRA